MSDKVIDITGKEDFDAKIAAAEWVVLVDFRAEWCGPCRMLGPVLHDIAEKYENVTVLKINVDHPDNQPISMEYWVRSIPQVNIFTWGEEVDKFIGALPPEQVEEFIAKHSA